MTQPTRSPGAETFDIPQAPKEPAAPKPTAQQKSCANLLEYLWQHGYLKRDDAMHFDKAWGDGTVGNRPWGS